MPYAKVVAYRHRNTVTIEIELPDHGEPSDRGRPENLVDPRAWIDLEEENDRLAIKMTVVAHTDDVESGQTTRDVVPEP
ncbi:MAG: hypothetical protein AABO41_12590 [Acidobacteriota bacterium]